MKAVRIPIAGPVEIVELAEPDDDDARAFLTDLYSVIGCDSVECVDLTDHIDAWLDETSRAHGKPLNPQATRLANACGIDDGLFGIVVILGADENTGEPASVTDDQFHEITRLVGTPPPQDDPMREPRPPQQRRPIIAINNRGLMLGLDPAGAWVLWNEHHTAWPAPDRLLWLLPLLERPPDVVTQTITAAVPDQQLLPALLRFALTSTSRYWTGLALGWLEDGYPPTELADALRELKDASGQPQPIRHRALRLWRSTTPV